MQINRTIYNVNFYFLVIYNTYWWILKGNYNLECLVQI